MGVDRLEEACWPLSFQLNTTVSDPATAGALSWSHELYRGPENQGVRVLYSRTKQDSEAIAQEFLNEPIVGFDMEWNWWIKKDSQARLQERIGLIQLACEDKIGLFHIGLHQGTQPKDLLAPSLRKIIQDPNITKTGVNIVKADFSRLREWFEIEPQGAFELSHLHNLVSYGATDPFKCTTKLFSLDKHVEAHLGLHLPKGDERMGRWSTPLSQKQKSYAAADAYAGFMLYHCMNAKRLGMLPQPPLPIHADKYTGTDRSTLLQLRPNLANGTVMTVVDFFQPVTETGNLPEKPSDVQAQSPEGKSIGVDETPKRKNRKSQSRTPRSAKVTPQKEPAHPFTVLDTIFSNRLFEKLRIHRSTTAKQRGYANFIVAHDTLLHDISRRCPTTESELLEIKGVGKNKTADYGQAWLSLVTNALKELQEVDLPGPPWKNTRPFDTNAGTSSGTSAPVEQSVVMVRRQPAAAQTSSSDVVDRLPPSLHTGLSFSIANTKLDDSEFDEMLSQLESKSDSSSAFEDDTRSHSPSNRKRKLERV